MKTIEPISVWYNGKQKQGSVLGVVANNDNLSSAASFTYQILAESDATSPMINGLEQVASGVLTMSGEVYDNWQTNDYAYYWVAEQLNLTITGEYVPSIA